MRGERLHLCSFQSAPDVTRRTTYEELKAAVLKAGRFSVFEATANARAASLFTSALPGPDRRDDEAGLPVDRRAREGGGPCRVRSSVGARGIAGRDSSAGRASGAAARSSRPARAESPGCTSATGPAALADGERPYDRQGTKKTCDKPVCAGCAVSIRNLDVDFCPGCARLAPSWWACLLRTLGPAPVGAPVHCRGAPVEKAQLCVRHAVLFDHWLGFEGGLEVYRSPQLNQEQRREVHRRWLRTTSPVPLSCITALVKLGDCYRAGDLTKPKTPWAFGPWCYEIADRFILPEPVLHGGMNGWWRVGERARVAIGEAWRAAGRAA